jgi:hypothetical protein
LIRSRAALIVWLVLAALLAAGCADQPRIWFENQRDDPVTVSIDGDRLIILRPHSGEFLPYSTAAWAWPRRVDVATFHGRQHLWSARLDADDLTRLNWIVYVRP